VGDAVAHQQADVLAHLSLLTAGRAELKVLVYGGGLRSGQLTVEVGGHLAAGQPA